MDFKEHCSQRIINQGFLCDLIVSSKSYLYSRHTISTGVFTFIFHRNTLAIGESQTYFQPAKIEVKKSLSLIYSFLMKHFYVVVTFMLCFNALTQGMLCTLHLAYRQLKFPVYSSRNSMPTPNPRDNLSPEFTVYCFHACLYTFTAWVCVSLKKWYCFAYF